jgi:hypothetical protein
MATEIAEIYKTIVKLEYDDVNGLTRVYDQLHVFQEKYSSQIDGRICNILDKIMSRKSNLNTSNFDFLKMKDQNEKWEALTKIQLNFEVKRGFQPQDTDILWRFLKDEDLSTEEQRHALGVEKKSYQIWQSTDLAREKDKGIQEIDNLVAKCVCTLDRRLKIFCMSETGERLNYHGSTTAEPKQVRLLLYQMEQMLLQ